MTTDFAAGAVADDSASDVVVTPDDVITVVGSASTDAGSDLAVARYHPDGTLDDSFGTAGLLTVDLHGGFDSGTDLALQPDGRVVAVGSARNVNAAENALIRLNH